MSVRDSLFSSLIRFAFRFERFIPYAVRLLLNRKLDEYQKDGRITDYTVRAGSRGRHHYLFQIDLTLDEDDVREVIKNFERKS